MELLRAALGGIKVQPPSTLFLTWNRGGICAGGEPSPDGGAPRPHPKTGQGTHGQPQQCVGMTEGRSGYLVPDRRREL